MPVLSFGTSSENLNFPDIRPSLDLNFAKTKVLDPRITFTRASTGTYVGSDGLIKTAAVNEPRFDHNPTTGESLGLLVEEQRTNLLVRSEEFDTTWTNNNLTITNNAITAPDGTLTAEKFVANTTNGDHRVFQTAAASTLGEVRTASAFFKAAEWNRCAIFVTTDAFANFTLTGSGTASVTIGISASIVPFGNGWYRCSVTYTSSVASSVVQLRVVNPSGAIQYAGDDTSGIYVWGAQLEVGSFPTSHIPTTSATVTRSADVASITGTNFSSWYRQDQMSIFASYQLLQQSGNTPSNCQLVGTGGPRLFFLAAYSGASVSRPRFFGPTGSNNIDMFPSRSGANTRTAIALDQNDNALSAMGEAVTTDTTGAPDIAGTIDTMTIGNYAANGSFLNGTISRLTYWPKRLSNDQLRLLTQ